jgi:hypothetical protein
MASAPPWFDSGRAEILRDLRRRGMKCSGAWLGMLRQVRRYADELRRVVKA